MNGSLGALQRTLLTCTLTTIAMAKKPRGGPRNSGKAPTKILTDSVNREMTRTPMALLNTALNKIVLSSTHNRSGSTTQNQLEMNQTGRRALEKNQVITQDSISANIVEQMNPSNPNSPVDKQQQGEAETSGTKKPVESDKEVAQLIQAKTQGGSKEKEIAESRDETGDKHNMKASWGGLFSANRVPGNAMSLAFIPPSIIEGKAKVTLEKAEIEKHTENWRNALVIYVMGDIPSYTAISNYIGRNWNSVAMPDLYYHDEGFYIAQFKNSCDRDDILYSGPYTYNHMPLILKKWTPDFDFKQEMPRTMPLWINFPNLPLYCWGAGSFE